MASSSIPSSPQLEEDSIDELPSGDDDTTIIFRLECENQDLKTQLDKIPELERHLAHYETENIRQREIIVELERRNLVLAEILESHIVGSSQNDEEEENYKLTNVIYQARISTLLRTLEEIEAKLILTSDLHRNAQQSVEAYETALIREQQRSRLNLKRQRDLTNQKQKIIDQLRKKNGARYLER